MGRSHHKWVVGLVPATAFLAVLLAVAAARQILGDVNPLPPSAASSSTNTLTPELFTHDFEYRTCCTVLFACFAISLALVAGVSLLTIWRYSATRTVFCISLAGSLFGCAFAFAAVHYGKVVCMPCESLSCITCQMSTVSQVVPTLAKAGIASFAFLLGAVALLILPTDLQHPHAVEQIARRIRHLRWLLYVGAFTLVINVGTVIIVYEWAATLLLGTDESRFAQSAAAATSIITGATYSLLLLALYGPALLVLYFRARLLGESQGDETMARGELREWLVNNGLEARMLDSLKRGALMLGPLLAGGVIPAILKIFR